MILAVHWHLAFQGDCSCVLNIPILPRSWRRWILELYISVGIQSSHLKQQDILNIIQHNLILTNDSDTEKLTDFLRVSLW